ncbi:MAG TPA: hypothetical protein ENF87_01755, partial [Thermoproteales archaeon]|nr:hypothetical protein [Thermoproteales archaeon]
MRLWMFGLPREKYADAIKFLKEKGFTDIVVGHNPDFIKAVKDAGLRVHVVWAVFRVEGILKKPKYLAEDPLGRKHVWFNSGCPNNPEIRKNILLKIENVITSYDVDGVILDGVRFASPGSGLEAFATCFCENCKEKMEEYGFNYNYLKSSVKGLLKNFYNIDLLKKWVNAYTCTSSTLIHLFIEYPGIVDWLKFRQLSIEEFIRDVRNLVKSYSDKIELGGYVFTPLLAPFVGQNYEMLWKYLDVVKPMIYRLGRGVACLNFELAKVAQDLIKWNNLSEEESLNLVYKFFGLIRNDLPTKIQDLLEKGVPVDLVGEETKRAKLLLNGRAEL